MRKCKLSAPPWVPGLRNRSMSAPPFARAWRLVGPHELHPNRSSFSQNAEHLRDATENREAPHDDRRE